MAMLHIPYYNHSHRDVIYREFVYKQEDIYHRECFFNGPYTQQLEQYMAEYLGYQYAIACSSGTMALYSLAYYLHTKSEARRAHVSHYTYQSVFGALQHARFELNKVPVNERYLNVFDTTIEPHDVVVITGLLGQNTFDVPTQGQYVFDASQNWQGLPAFSDQHALMQGHLILSFDPSKSLGGASTGGMILTNCANANAYLRNLVRSRPDATRHIFGEYSLNFRMSEVEALYLVLQFPFIQTWLGRRRLLAKTFDEVFGPELTLIRDYSTDEAQKYAIRVKDPKRTVELAISLGIEARVLYQSDSVTPLVGLPLYPRLAIEETADRYSKLKRLLERKGLA